MENGAVVGTALTWTVAAIFAVVGLLKVLRIRWAVGNAEHLGFSPGAFAGIGALELAGAAGLLVGLHWWRPIGIAAAAGLVALMVGAVWALRRAGDRPVASVPAVWLAALVVASAVLT